MPTHADISNLDPLLTPSDAARVLGVGQRCIENWRHRGGGPRYVRISARCIRYREADLLAWIAERVRRHSADEGHGL